MNKLKFLTPIVILAIAAGFSAVVMLLWNCLIPTIFGLTAIGFWQALGLLLLCRILFGSFGGGHKIMLGGMIHRHSPLREKWLKLSPEQQHEFIKKRMEHFGKCGFFVSHFKTDENTPKEQ